MAVPLRNRFFGNGERVRVSKKTYLVDRERKHEGIPKGVHAEPIEENVTGIEGEVAGPSYQSPAKGGEWHVPIAVGNGGVIAVPEHRLERENRTPRADRSEVHQGQAVSKEAVEFWRDYFRKEDELARLGARTPRRK